MSDRERASSSGHPTSFGRLLREHRRAAGLSQAALAEQAGLGERAIQRLEADQNRPYRATVELLMSALQLTPAQRDELLAAIPPAAREQNRLHPAAERASAAHLRLVGSHGQPATEPDPAVAAPLRESRSVCAPRSRLIGRASEVAQICELLVRPDVGLVTLTGPGGSGKTRLAIQVAAELTGAFADGVTFVHLALVTDPASVPMAIVQALDLMDLGDQPPDERLKRRLKDQHALLVLDNFEHVMAARVLVSDLLDACPRLAVLVTSREVLHLYGERDVPVLPLESPLDDPTVTLDTAALFPAVELFVERTQEVRPDFRLTTDNVAAVVAICRRLDGLPLAIELAAARGRLLSPVAMLGRLERSLNLLVDGPRDRPARQQTLRGATAWSYDMLEPREQRTFQRLSVFVGGWTLEAAEAVTDDPHATLDDIGSLVDKSLLITLPDVASEPRYGMLETIREFASEQLIASGDAALFRRQHADYCVGLAERAAPRLLGGEQVSWLVRLGAEHANIGAALTWLGAQDTPDSAQLALRLAGALHWYWWLGGAISEGRTWIRTALACVSADDPAAVPLRARALYAAGGLAMVQGEYPVASTLLDEACSLFRQLDDRQGLGRAMVYRSILDTFARDPHAARARLLESLDVLHGVNDAWGLGLAGSNLGAVTRSLGETEEADRLLKQYVPVARQTGDRYLLGSALPKWAHVSLARGDPAHAEELVREALGLFQVFNDGWWTARCLNLLTVMAADRGDHLRAARLLGAAEHLLHHSGAQLVPTDVARSDRMSQTLRASLGETGFQEACAEGRLADLDQIVRYAMDSTANSLT